MAFQVVMDHLLLTPSILAPALGPIGALGMTSGCLRRSSDFKSVSVLSISIRGLTLWGSWPLYHCYSALVASI